MLTIFDDELHHIFRYDHQERLTAEEASAHPYFASIREAATRGAGSGTAGYTA